jgi:hypothetical protein
MEREEKHRLVLGGDDGDGTGTWVSLSTRRRGRGGGVGRERAKETKFPMGLNSSVRKPGMKVEMMAVCGEDITY